MLHRWRGMMPLVGVVRCAREIATHQHEIGRAEGADQTDDSSNAHDCTLTVSFADGSPLFSVISAYVPLRLPDVSAIFEVVMTSQDFVDHAFLGNTLTAWALATGLGALSARTDNPVDAYSVALIEGNRRAQPSAIPATALPRTDIPE